MSVLEALRDAVHRLITRVRELEESVKTPPSEDQELEALTNEINNVVPAPAPAQESLPSEAPVDSAMGESVASEEPPHEPK